MAFIIRIGLEVHIQLKTATKLFSMEPHVLEQIPNNSIDPVTTGLPGVLPSVNQKTIDLAIILALASNCKINRQITFDRKNYFYPDLPKGYQITQKNKTIFSREKESVADYGYITEPNILPIAITRAKIKTLKTEISELPSDRFQRFIKQYQLEKNIAYILSLNHDLSLFFESVYPKIINKQEFIHFLSGPFKAIDKKDAEKSYDNKKLKYNIISLLNMITQNEISRETAYQNLWPKLLVSENKTTFDLAKTNKWLLNHNETELLTVIKKIIGEFPEEVKKYKNGKSKIVGFFMGQIMKRTKNRFKPQKAKILVLEELNKK